MAAGNAFSNSDAWAFTSGFLLQPLKARAMVRAAIEKIDNCSDAFASTN